MTELNFDAAFEPGLSAWVKWPEGGFDVHLKYLPMSEAERIVKECQVKEWDPRTHQRGERMDEEKFKRKLCDLIVDWRGLTAEKAAKFINLKPDTEPGAEFPCTPKAKLFVVAQFAGFPTFVLDAAKSLHQLKEEADQEERKNS